MSTKNDRNLGFLLMVAGFIVSAIIAFSFAGPTVNIPFQVIVWPLFLFGLGATLILSDYVEDHLNIGETIDNLDDLLEQARLGERVLTLLQAGDCSFDPVCSCLRPLRHDQPAEDRFATSLGQALECLPHRSGI